MHTIFAMRIFCHDMQRNNKKNTRKAKGMPHFFHFDCQTYYFPTERINTEIFIKAFSLHFSSHKSFYFRSHNTNDIYELLCRICTTLAWKRNSDWIGSHGKIRAKLKTNFEIAFCQRNVVFFFFFCSSSSYENKNQWWAYVYDTKFIQ